MKSKEDCIKAIITEVITNSQKGAFQTNLMPLINEILKEFEKQEQNYINSFTQ